MTSPALLALLAAIYDRRGSLPEPIVSLAEIVEREVADDGPKATYQQVWKRVGEPHGAPARDPADDHPLEWGLR